MVGDMMQKDYFQMDYGHRSDNEGKGMVVDAKIIYTKEREKEENRKE